MSGEHHFHGSTFTPRGILYFNSLAEITAEEAGIGALFVGGKLYWCDGTDIVAQNADLAVVVEAPAAADSTGTAGQIAYDATHIYVCVDTDTWVRADLATWGGE
jgi:hypothetical protein